MLDILKSVRVYNTSSQYPFINSTLDLDHGSGGAQN